MVLAMLSMLPQYNEKMITVHLMCPIVFLRHSGIFFRTISTFSDQIEVVADSDLNVKMKNEITTSNYNILGGGRIN